MTPFYLDDLPALRRKLQRAEENGALLGRIWAAVRRRGRASPEGFSWFVPFIAVITGEEQDIESAKRVIRHYLATLDPQCFGMGLQFHFWCYAFPHARWSLYFQWLAAMGVWDAAEEREIRERLLVYQFLNFFYGMRTKPEPECVDNQTLSLCFSNALLGYIFGRGSGQRCALAERMYRDGIRRLPSMLGGFPASGYSGEGSTYMDHVVGPCIPYVVELLERAVGGEWYHRSLPPAGGSAAHILRMIAREWTPCGLTLPWDHYGWSLPMRSAMAYASRRSRDPMYRQILERYASWTHDIGVGWGFDDLVWTLIWWPEEENPAAGTGIASWAEPEIGGAIVSPQADLYLMQEWDRSEPGCPGRAHVNPNALTLVAYGSPLTADGICAKSCTSFDFDDTWREVAGADFQRRRYNFGQGCAGAHGVLLVDGWEGMRAEGDYPQIREALRLEPTVIGADVTPIYRERFPDINMAARLSRFCDRFWLVEDRLEAESEHVVTCRWYLRPTLIASERGVIIETAEGVRLTLLPLLGSDDKRVRTIAGYPDRLDGESLQVDFRQRGRLCRWLWLLWPEARRKVQQEIDADWQVYADAANREELAEARKDLLASQLRLPFDMPAFMLRDLPLARRWWYRQVFTAPPGRWWLRLPINLRSPRLWLNDQEVDLAPYLLRGRLLMPQIEAPQGLGHEIEAVVRTDCSLSQYGPDADGGTCFWGKPAIMVEDRGEPLLEARLEGSTVFVKSTASEWRVAIGDGLVYS